jgi:hypothetical protein
MKYVKKGNFGSSRFGKFIFQEFEKDQSNTIFAAAWGVYISDGGLYWIEKDRMISVSDLFVIDCKVLLNVIYDRTKDILYRGSNGRVIYEVFLDKMIIYCLFEGYLVLDFDKNGEQIFVLHTKGLTIFRFLKGNFKKCFSL